MADRLISCDDHMDLSQLPADLWTTRLPASLLDRAPHIEERRQHQRPPRPRAPSPRPRFQAITPPAPHPRWSRRHSSRFAPTTLAHRLRPVTR
jgi:hypothetical protein